MFNKNRKFLKNVDLVLICIISILFNFRVFSALLRIKNDSPYNIKLRYQQNIDIFDQPWKFFKTNKGVNDPNKAYTIKPGSIEQEQVYPHPNNFAIFTDKDHPNKFELKTCNYTPTCKAKYLDKYNILITYNVTDNTFIIQYKSL